MAGVTVTFKLSSKSGQQIQVDTDPWGPAVTTANQTLIGTPKASAPDAAGLQYTTPDHPDTIVITATASGYTPATLELPMISVGWIERTPYQGFTPSTPPWVVLGVGNNLKSSASKLFKSDAATNVVLSVADGSIASISPTQASGTSTDTDIIGSQVGETHASAKDGANEMATLGIEVKNTKRENIQLVYVKDTAGHDGTLANHDSVVAGAHDMYVKQAVVDVAEADAPLVYTIDGDLGATPTMDTVTAKNRLYTPREQGVRYVFVWWDFAPSEAGGFASPNSDVTLKKSASAVTLAHELGHVLGLVHYNGDHNIMGSHGSEAGNRIEKWQADIVNPN